MRLGAGAVAGAMTVVFTALALALLAQRGKLPFVTAFAAPAPAPAAARPARAAPIAKDAKAAKPAQVAEAARFDEPADDDERGWRGVLVHDRSVEVAATMPGSLRQVAVVLGQQVTSGQLLAELDGRVAREEVARANAAAEAARAGVQAARKDLEEATLIHDRDQALATRGILPAQEAEGSRHRLDRARAQLRAARARADELGAGLRSVTTQQGAIQLLAPFAGAVALIHQREGAVVAAGQPVIRLVGVAGRGFRAAVPQRAAGSLGLQAPVILEDESSGRRLRGVIERISPEPLASSGLVIVEGTVQLAAGDPAPSISSPLRVTLAPPGDER
jgi:RND family efflux transporter MFP subunit